MRVAFPPMGLGGRGVVADTKAQGTGEAIVLKLTAGVVVFSRCERGLPPVRPSMHASTPILPYRASYDKGTGQSRTVPSGRDPLRALSCCCCCVEKACEGRTDSR